MLNFIDGTILAESTWWILKVANDAAVAHTLRGEIVGCVSQCPNGHRRVSNKPRRGQCDQTLFGKVGKRAFFFFFRDFRLIL